MFRITCTSCGREEEWKAGARVGTLIIEVCGSTVFCTCGDILTEEPDGILRSLQNKEDAI